MNLGTKRYFTCTVVCTTLACAALVCALIVCSELQATAITAARNYTINLNQPINISNALTANPATTVAATATASNSNSISNQSMIYLKKMREYGRGKFSSLQAWLWAHKYKIGAGCIVLFLGGTYFYFYSTNRFLSDKSHWFWWPEHLSFDELLNQDPKTIREALTSRIQEKYFDAHNPTNGLEPLIRFARDIEKEERQLKKYITICSWASRLWVTKIPFFPKLQLEVAQSALHRLLFIKQQFIAWAAEQNLFRMDVHQGLVKSVVRAHRLAKKSSETEFKKGSKRATRTVLSNLFFRKLNPLDLCVLVLANLIVMFRLIKCAGGVVWRWC
jgi:hypothetical protein